MALLEEILQLNDDFIENNPLEVFNIIVEMTNNFEYFVKSNRSLLNEEGNKFLNLLDDKLI